MQSFATHYFPRLWWNLISCMFIKVFIAVLLMSHLHHTIERKEKGVQMMVTLRCDLRRARMTNGLR